MFVGAIQERGLAMSTKSLLTSDELLRHFGIDLAAADVVAIRVAVRNGTRDRSYTVPSERISLGHLTVGSSHVDPSKALADSAQRVSLAGAFLLSPLLNLLGAKQASDSLIVKENLEANRFRSVTIDPGKSANGFVYFSLSGLTALNSGELCVSAVETSAQNELRICQTVSIRRQK